MAVKEIRRTADGWTGRQAFRDKRTGALHQWVEVRLTIEEHRITKYFPTTVPFEECVYGYMEYYFREAA